MPRKIRKPASATENRENQRRSRARRRELVQDLQEKVARFEREGVQASIELQRIAKALELENHRLRALLDRKGVAPDEIARHLRATGYDDAPTATHSSDPSQHPPPTSIPNISYPRRLAKSSKTLTNPPAPNATFPSGDTHSSQHRLQDRLTSVVSPRLAQGRPAVSITYPNAGPEDYASKGALASGAQKEKLPPFLYPPQLSTNLSRHVSGTMSCKTAIGLVAGMHHSSQKDEIKGLLRCGQTDNCEVETSEVFSVIDQIL
ncbi:uncharacterized protein F5Z01DRAFT_275548 [Emericellopsis atlantica]|uniref:BZIP domain-containing protein n=1 Tax=Emericellopsis atlantica TaxID=2614577 RepID=A0A9P8CLH9_9HYPO|nr:uncharacterized protein F5Z01DRAFT_275548 [Emericellopsis atlantica]KAG9251654.1 hypothetical protein F5Z01DRAFT_275548 [Emericellopsis atlantica]